MHTFLRLSMRKCNSSIHPRISYITPRQPNKHVPGMHFLSEYCLYPLTDASETPRARANPSWHGASAQTKPIPPAGPVPRRAVASSAAPSAASSAVANPSENRSRKKMPAVRGACCPPSPVMDDHASAFTSGTPWNGAAWTVPSSCEPAAPASSAWPNWCVVERRRGKREGEREGGGGKGGGVVRGCVLWDSAWSLGVRGLCQKTTRPDRSRRERLVTEEIAMLPFSPLGDEGQRRDSVCVA